MTTQRITSIQTQNNPRQYMALQSTTQTFQHNNITKHNTKQISTTVTYNKTWQCTTNNTTQFGQTQHNIEQYDTTKTLLYRAQRCK